MNELGHYSRSPELMTPATTALVVIDVQERLLPAVDGGPRVAWNIRRLLDAARTLDVSVVGTEQYPKGLGPTVPEIAERLGVVPSKLTFSAAGCTAIFDELRRKGIHNLLLAGIETHVCVAQSAMDLMADGWRVFVAADAVGSRFEIDHCTALRRLDSAGATLTTTEAAMFEWCATAEAEGLKQISRLAREAAPCQGRRLLRAFKIPSAGRL